MRKAIFTTIVLLFFFTTIKANTSSTPRTIHVYVALCDNINQGIVPVPAAIGNGQDAGRNLYWGAGYGVKNYFHRKSDNWTLIKTLKNPKTNILERVVFKNTSSNTYLIADAYDGAKIKECITDFLFASAGQNKDTISINNIKLPISGSSNLIAYIGHNGLMEFSIDTVFQPVDDKKRDVIILACYSKEYFTSFMEEFQANPLVWSKGLMSPEAYTLKWAIDGWLQKESNEQIVERARKAYNHYQKCGMRGATNLLATGF